MRNDLLLPRKAPVLFLRFYSSASASSFEVNFSLALFGVAQTPSEGPFRSGNAIFCVSCQAKASSRRAPVVALPWEAGACSCCFVFLLCVAPNLPLRLMCCSPVQFMSLFRCGSMTALSVYSLS